MASCEMYSITELESLPYRELQKKGKSVKVPSNVKKVHLIKLIYTKLHGTDEQLEALIQKVKEERLLSSPNFSAGLAKTGTTIANSRPIRATRLQVRKLSSTSEDLKSPHIHLTPQRTKKIILGKKIIKPRKTTKYTLAQVNKYFDDRVLRNRTNVAKKCQDPNLYNAVVNVNNDVVRYINPNVCKTKEFNHNSRITSDHNLTSNKYNVTSFNPDLTSNKSNLTNDNVNLTSNKSNLTSANSNLTTRSNLRSDEYSFTSLEPRLIKVIDNGRHKPSILGAGAVNVRPRAVHNNYVLLKKNREDVMRPSGINTKIRQRRISGIEPIEQENPSFHYIQSFLRIKNPDGSIRKLDTMIRKPLTLQLPSNQFEQLNTRTANKSIQTQRRSMLLQSVKQTTKAIDYPKNQTNSRNNPSINQISNSKTGQYEEIRQESVRRMSLLKMTRNEYPSVNSSNECWRTSEPIYCMANVHSLSSNPPLYQTKQTCQLQDTNVLETIYNYKNIYIRNSPLLPIPTTSSTRCVYMSPVMASAMENVNSAPANSACSFYNQPPSSIDLLSCLDRVDSSESTSLTIPDMVEDALEIISQDGDYMERIEMDIRMECFLCSWAGPKIILPNHLRKDHSSAIQKSKSREWHISVALDALTISPLWHCEVIESDSSDLYVLSAAYVYPDCLMASITRLASDLDKPQMGVITVYNKVSGEPFSWTGIVETLPPTLPYDNNTNCLKVNLSKLDLLPNSANLMLLNGILEMKVPGKVVCGQPKLNDIHVIFFVKVIS